MQLLEINRLDQMKIEPGFFGTLHILLSAEAGERNCFDLAFRARLRGYFVTAPIRQTDITQNHVDVICAYEMYRAFHIFCSYNVVPKMSK